jgi:hypothetical protein
LWRIWEKPIVSAALYHWASQTSVFSIEVLERISVFARVIILCPGWRLWGEMVWSRMISSGCVSMLYVYRHDCACSVGAFCSKFVPFVFKQEFMDLVLQLFSELMSNIFPLAKMWVTYSRTFHQKVLVKCYLILVITS